MQVISEEYLVEQIAQMDQIILKALGAKEIMTAQLQYIQGSKENGDKPKQEEKTTCPQPGTTEEQYANGNNCRAGSCD